MLPLVFLASPRAATVWLPWSRSLGSGYMSRLLWAQVMRAWTLLRTLLASAIWRAVRRAAARAGRRIPTSRAMMAMTTRSSMRVKPRATDLGSERSVRNPRETRRWFEPMGRMGLVGLMGLMGMGMRLRDGL